MVLVLNSAPVNAMQPAGMSVIIIARLPVKVRAGILVKSRAAQAVQVRANSTVQALAPTRVAPAVAMRVVPAVAIAVRGQPHCSKSVIIDETFNPMASRTSQDNYIHCY